MKRGGLFLPHCLGWEVCPNIVIYEVLQFLVLVDRACEVKFAKETSRNNLRYIKPLFSNFFLHNWKSIFCGLWEFEMHIFTSQPFLLKIKPLTPVLPVTGCDRPWPFFHFWRHHFWPKLASSILNFCRRKRSFQWCPDQSDRPNGAWDMHKDAQKVEGKTWTKISCHCTWLLHGKNCPSWWRFLRTFLTSSKPSRRSITAAKRREKEKKERQKKNPKLKKPKDYRKNLNFCPCLSQNGLKRNASGKKGKRSVAKCVFNQIEVYLAEIQPKNHQKKRSQSVKVLGKPKNPTGFSFRSTAPFWIQSGTQQ